MSTAEGNILQAVEVVERRAPEELNLHRLTSNCKHDLTSVFCAKSYVFLSLVDNVNTAEGDFHEHRLWNEDFFLALVHLADLSSEMQIVKNLQKQSYLVDGLDQNVIAFVVSHFHGRQHREVECVSLLLRRC